MLPDFQPVKAVRDLTVLARLLDAWTEIPVSQRDAVSVAARRIDNLPSRDSTVSVDLVATTPTVGGGRVGNLLAVAVLLCWCELSHREPTVGAESLAGNSTNMPTEPILRRLGCRMVFRVIPLSPALVFDLCHHVQSALVFGSDVAVLTSASS